MDARSQKIGQQQPRAEPIKISEDELKTKIQVVFNKFVKNEAPVEEEGKAADESKFTVIKELIQSGVLDQGDGKEKKVRAEDVFSAFNSKMIDMDQTVLNQNFSAFMQEWFDSRCVNPESWKFVVKRSIQELENYVCDIPKLPLWLCSGLIVPLMKQRLLQTSDLAWFVEEEKEDLFDVKGQY